MMSHSTGTKQMREESENRIRKWEETWLKMTAEDGEREGGQQWCAMEDWSRDKRLWQDMLCRQQWTYEYVKCPEMLKKQNVVDIWLQCLLVNVICNTDMLAPDHVDICMPKQWLYRWYAEKPPTIMLIQLINVQISLSLSSCLVTFWWYWPWAYLPRWWRLLLQLGPTW